MNIQELLQLNEKERLLKFVQLIAELEQTVCDHLLSSDKSKLGIIEKLAHFEVMMSLMVSKGDIDINFVHQNVMTIFEQNKNHLSEPLKQVSHLYRVK